MSPDKFIYGRQIAQWILSASYEKELANASHLIDRLSQLQYILDCRNIAGHVPLNHAIFHPPARASHRGRNSVYDVLSDFNAAPSLNQIYNRCETIQANVEAIGRLARFLLLIERAHPGKSSVNKAAEMHEATEDDHGDDRPDKTLIGLWSRYKYASHACATVVILNEKLINLWCGPTGKTRGILALSIAHSVRTSLGDVAPRNADIKPDPDWGTYVSHLKVVNMGHWPSPVRKKLRIRTLRLAQYLRVRPRSLFGLAEASQHQPH